MIIRTQFSSYCAGCKKTVALIDQYCAVVDSVGPAVVRRFVCPRCYSNISTSAMLFDQKMKAQVLLGRHDVDGRESRSNTGIKREMLRDAEKEAAKAEKESRERLEKEMVVKLRDAKKAVRRHRKKLPAVQIVADLSPAQQLLSGVMMHDKSGNAREAVQRVLEVVDDWMRDSRWSDCASLLTLADPWKLSHVVSFGLLTALSNPAVIVHTHEQRRVFIESLKNCLRTTRPNEAEALMRGVG